MSIALLLSIAAAAAVVNSYAYVKTEDLTLRCAGGLTTMQTTGTAVITGSGAFGSSIGTMRTQTPVTGQAIIDLEIRSGRGRIRLPSEMVPSANEGEGGWFGVTEMSMNEGRIEGRVRVNFVNVSRFTIDRSTGVLTTNKGFRADCEKVDTTTRKF